MSVYAYEGANAEGARERGFIEAPGLKEARTRLVSRGITPYRLSPATLSARLSEEARSDLYRGLGTLLQAGFPLERSLGLLLDGASSESSQAGLLAALRDRVREGAGLSAALDALCPGLPRFELAALAAAERSGAQGAMLDRLAAHLDERRETESRLRSALAYPCFVLCAGLALASLMLYGVVPRAIALLVGSQGGAPRSALATAAVGRGVLTAILVLLAVAGTTALLAWMRGRRDPAFAARADRLVYRLPVLGALRAKQWSLRFARTLGLMLQAGEPAVEALPMAALSTGSAWLAGEGAVQAERVRNGASLSDAVRALSPIAPSLAEWVRIGETSGNLQGMLEQAAIRCRQTHDRTLARLLGLLEPMLILLVGLLVLAVALTVLVPMLDLALHAAGA
ncbi:MAG: type II secretion system F family protein [Kiritimatiellia bacterium]|jgi:general secretion pathway protein F